MSDGRVAYLSGPMTGLPGHNYTAFYDAEAYLEERGFAVLCPARNFNGRLDLPRWFYMRQDITSVLQADFLVVLEGWQGSAGSRLEVLLARELNLPVFDLEGRPVLEAVHSITETFGKDLIMKSMGLGMAIAEGPPALGDVPRTAPPPYTVLEEAQGLIHGDRQQSYGHPADDFRRTGRLWGALLGIPDIDPERVGLMMASLKASRAINDLDLHRPIKRDNLVDGCGYLGTVEMVQQRGIEEESLSAVI